MPPFAMCCTSCSHRDHIGGGDDLYSENKALDMATGKRTYIRNHEEKWEAVGGERRERQKSGDAKGESGRTGKRERGERTVGEDWRRRKKHKHPAKIRNQQRGWGREKNNYPGHRFISKKLLKAGSVLLAQLHSLRNQICASQKSQGRRESRDMPQCRCHDRN